MFYAALSPQAALLSTFGEALEGPVAEIVVRNWGALVGVVGLLLIYGAFNPPVRRVALSSWRYLAPTYWPRVRHNLRSCLSQRAVARYFLSFTTSPGQRRGASWRAD
ncbi:MAG: hypothetical protein ACKVPX_05930 [Myxococcaceae bacterium]